VVDVDEDIIDELHMQLETKKSSSMAEARPDKWKAMKKKSFL